MPLVKRSHLPLLSLIAILIIALDLGEKEVNELREEYSNAKNFYDGDIFRCLRRAHLAGNTFAKARWLSKLSRTKIRDIDLLEKRAAKDPQPDIYNVPSTTCFRSPVFGQPYRLVPFTGCSHCDVPRRAFPITY